jgi:hypothetical protein
MALVVGSLTGFRPKFKISFLLLHGLLSFPIPEWSSTLNKSVIDDKGGPTTSDWAFLCCHGCCGGEEKDLPSTFVFDAVGIICYQSMTVKIVRRID